MAGLDLMTQAGFRFGGGSGNYAPLTPASAVPPSSRISEQAYGVSGSGASTYNDNTAWIGSVGLGAVSLILLGYLWWSLPR